MSNPHDKQTEQIKQQAAAKLELWAQQSKKFKNASAEQRSQIANDMAEAAVIEARAREAEARARAAARAKAKAKAEASTGGYRRTKHKKRRRKNRHTRK